MTNPNLDGPIVLVDQFEIQSQEPIVAQQDPRLEQAYARIVSALTQAHQSRFRHVPPADERDLFRELQEEIVLPHEELVGKLIMNFRAQQRLDPQDEEAILAIVEEFCVRVKSLDDES